MNENISPLFQMTVKKMTGSMNFIGLFIIIVGVISCLTIVGALIGVPYIIMGLRLRESAESFNMYLMNSESAFLERAVEKQERYFFIQKVLMIVGIVILIIYIILLIVFGAALFHSHFSNLRTV
jgi:beta-lactamase regulating signal transducer with metallopeptidase domain